MTTDSPTSNSPQGVLIPAAQGLEMSKANARRELERMAKSSRREKLMLAILIALSLMLAASWTYFSAVAQRGVEQSGRAMTAKIAKEHPELSAKVGGNISCAVTRQKEQVGPLQYMKMTPSAMAEAIGSHALACAQAKGNEALNDMRIALFQPPSL